MLHFYWPFLLYFIIPLTKDSEMVIQEAIPLLKYKDNPFDIRALVQKDGSGKWKVTGIIARIFAEGSIISSPRSGGKIAPIEQVLMPKLFREEVLEGIEHFTTQAAARIDQELGLFAELGFDLGIDQSGKVWLIEINGKPLKVSLDRLLNHHLSTLAYTRPLEYAIYLAGNRSQGNVCN